jgi:hypothetical protein
MPSLINTTEIDTEFPVPGQDNDSQGFRDNFTNIKTNLDTAKTEIETLQDTTVKINADTTFLTSGGGAPVQLINANLKSFSTAKFPPAALDEIKASTQLTLDFSDGDYQVYQFTQPEVEINFDQEGWPTAGRVGKITLELTSTAAGGTTIAFDNNLNVKLDSSWNNGETVISNNTNPVIIELWTRTRGTTIFAYNKGIFD